MPRKRDFRVVRAAMLTTSVAASGLVYWGVAANVVIEQGDNLTATAQYEPIQPRTSVGGTPN